jgi:cysteinyl-tRNA synthetase
VPLRLYDTGTRSVRDFVPLEPGKASIYLCGLTVQGPPHIGHARNYVTTDILNRWLRHSGYDVTYVRNVTDIEDKVLVKSRESGQPWWAIAFRNERAIAAAERTLGCLPPTYEPRATGHVTEMIELIQRIIDAGHAYSADGDVFFDVQSWPPYGELSGQRVDEMQPAADSPATGKRDPRDFALWKAHKPDEPADASWPTPWGRGRPGWHLECSAMSTKYLGPTFDIHGGGLDLVFPHHENELAQSRAAGDGFARYWLHNALLNLSGEKMSKSLGNVLGLAEMAQRWRPVELRYYLGSAHYRSPMEYTEDALREAGVAYKRIENFVDRAAKVVANGGQDFGLQGIVCAEFADAMDDDLGVPQALAALHNVVREGNSALAAGNLDAARGALCSVLAMTELLGINPTTWRADRGSDLTPVVSSLVRGALAQREEARAGKDFAAADAIRDQLAAAGIVIEDTPDGPRWSMKDSE